MPMAVSRGTVVWPRCPALVIPLTGTCPVMPPAPATQPPEGTTAAPEAPCELPPGVRPPIAVNCAAGEQLEIIGG